MSSKSNRREFIQNTSAIGAGLWVTGGRSWAQEKAEKRSANGQVSYACIGVGGKGRSDSSDAAQHGDVVAICDVDDQTLEKSAKNPAFKNPATFNDFREMLDKMGDKIDAVTVSTPDHVHAVAAAMAMKAGKHCFCQKPLTHSVYEARMLAQIAREKGVKTQMGNQGTAANGLREAAAIIQAGYLGNVKEVHCMTNRPIWAQGGPRPEAAPVPPHVHWDLWLGPAPERPYAPGYHPFAWRGWWDFGTGALGDMACHTVNMPFMALNMADPVSIQATTSGHNQDSYPQSSKIVFEFPERDGRAPFTFTWYDGGNLPSKDLLLGGDFVFTGKSARGSIVVGEKATLYATDDYANDFKLLPEGEIEKPKVDFEASPGHFTEFHEAILGKRDQARSNFPNYAGPLSETILLGNLAVWVATEADVAGKKIEWNSEKMQATNAPEVAHVIHRDYREGYSL